MHASPNSNAVVVVQWSTSRRDFFWNEVVVVQLSRAACNELLLAALRCDGRLVPANGRCCAPAALLKKWRSLGSSFEGANFM